MPSCSPLMLVSDVAFVRRADGYCIEVCRFRPDVYIPPVSLPEYATLYDIRDSMLMRERMLSECGCESVPRGGESWDGLSSYELLCVLAELASDGVIVPEEAVLAVCEEVEFPEFTPVEYRSRDYSGYGMDWTNTWSVDADGVWRDSYGVVLRPVQGTREATDEEILRYTESVKRAKDAPVKEKLEISSKLRRHNLYYEDFVAPKEVVCIGGRVYVLTREGATYARSSPEHIEGYISSHTDDFDKNAVWHVFDAEKLRRRE